MTKLVARLERKPAGLRMMSEGQAKDAAIQGYGEHNVLGLTAMKGGSRPKRRQTRSKTMIRSLQS